MGGLAWSIFAILAMVGIVTSYSQVGFPNMNQFAQYLFGVTPYPGALSYVPWLYDVLLAAYVLTVLAGIVALLRVRSHGAETTAA
jgi:transposase InsO family protein